MVYLGLQDDDEYGYDGYDAPYDTRQDESYPQGPVGGGGAERANGFVRM